MKKDSEGLRIAEEDVLRTLGERGNGAPIREIKEELHESSLFDKAVGRLADRGFLTVREGLAELTPKGKEAAGRICEKHSVLEDFWKKSALKSKDEAHRAAHLLEHHVSKQVLDNIRLISEIKEEGVPLSEFRGAEGMIANILLEGGTFERLVSMGFSPGETLGVAQRLSNSIVITIKNKKLAVDREIAADIKILEGVGPKGERA